MIENGSSSVSKTDTTYKVIDIPSGLGYRIYISDDSSQEFSFGASNYSPSFDIRKLVVDIDYDEVREKLSHTTNASVYDYKWYRDNTLWQYDSESSEGIENGLYMVEITDQFGCIVKDSVEVVRSTVGLEELDEMALEIYPNPSDGLIYVNYNLAQESVSSIQVISLTGEVVHRVQLEGNSRIETTLDLESLSAGMYLLQIEMNEQIVHRRISIK
jgi:hypothetical protein